MNLKSDRPVLATVVGMLLLALGTVWLGMASRIGKGPAWDEQIMKSTRKCVDRIAAPVILSVKEAIRDISALGGMTVLGMVSVVASGCFLIRRDYAASCILLGSWLLGWGLMNGLKYL